VIWEWRLIVCLQSPPKMAETALEAQVKELEFPD